MALATVKSELHTMDDVLAHAWERVSGKAECALWRRGVPQLAETAALCRQRRRAKLLSVPTRFMREWINTHYADDIRELWQQEQASEGYAIEIIVNATGRRRFLPRNLHRQSLIRPSSPPAAGK